MQQQISVVILSVSDLERSKRFYRDGFGWTSVFENEEIAFYQMNGLVFGTWLKGSFEKNTRAQELPTAGAMSLALRFCWPLRLSSSWHPSCGCSAPERRPSVQVASWMRRIHTQPRPWAGGAIVRGCVSSGLVFQLTYPMASRCRLGFVATAVKSLTACAAY